MYASVKNVVEFAIEELSLLHNRLNDSFDAVLTQLYSADEVIIMGVGKSGIIGQKIAATLTSIGKRALFLHPVEAMHGDIGIVKVHTAIIIISNSGTTAELMAIMPYIRKRNVTIIGILGNIHSPLASLCDSILDASVQREACPLNLAPTTSTLIALTIGDMLAVGLMEKTQFTAEDFAISHPAGLLGKSLSTKVQDVMHTHDRLPLISSRASFKEAILENSRKSLGGVIITDDGKSIVGLLTDGDVRRALEHYDDLRDISLTEVMTKQPLTIHQTALLGEALSLMEHRRSKINVLPVIDDDSHLVGLIRLHDILSY
jgi:arabinose-5-phosphate isomerase